MSGLGVLVNDGGASEEFIYKIIAPTSSSKDAVLDLSDKTISGLAPVQSVAGKTGDIILSSHDIPLDTVGDTTVSDAITLLWSTGVISGGLLLNNGDGTVNIEQCEVVIRTSANSNAPLTIVTLPLVTNLELLDNTTNYIVIDYNLGNPIYTISSSSSSFNGLNKCLVWVVSKENLELHVVDAREQNIDVSTKIRQLFLNYSKFIHAQGGTVLSSIGLNLLVTPGIFYYMIKEIPHDSFDSSIPGLDYRNTFSSYYRNTSGGWTKVLNDKDVNTTLYDNGSGTLAPIGNNKFVNRWVYLILNTPAYLATVYGQQEFNSLDLAIEESAPSILPQALFGTGVLIGRVTFEKAALSFAKVESAFTKGFSTSASSEHNILGGLQGGALNEYFHLTIDEHNDLTIKSFLDVFDKVKRNSDSITNSYDLEGRLSTQEFIENLIVTYIVTYNYYDGKLISKTISKPLGSYVTLTYLYDEFGKLSTITQTGDV